MSGVCFFEKLSEAKKPRSRVELHIHLDGAVRLDTVWELSKSKGVRLGVECYEDLVESVQLHRPVTLAQYLKAFDILLPVFIGDAEAIERAAYELCEDQANDGVLYFETRYSPHMFSNTDSPLLTTIVERHEANAFTPRQAVQAVNRGLAKGQEHFAIKARSILVCIRGRPEWNPEVLDLCVEFKDSGVVGMDIAGPEDFSEEDVAVFQKAASLGIHRTAHAGQAATPSKVAFVIEQMKVERVGHGYRSVLDSAVYEKVLQNGIHLEVCPHSSILTGAVPLTLHKHPIIRFAEDGVNFSINKDDPSITNTTLDDEYKILEKMGLNSTHFTRANFNAVRACFLPESEKCELFDELLQTYGAHYKEIPGGILRQH